MGGKKKRPRQYHPAYRGAIELTLKDNAEDLIFEEEVSLNTLPRKIDLLVIRKKEDVEIRSILGKIFRRINIWELKSPGDALGKEEFFKTSSYLYQYLSEHPEIKSVNDCTLSFVREGRPRELMKWLRGDGYREEMVQAGLYWYRKESFPDIQIINISASGMPSWLRLLTKKAEKEDYTRSWQEFKNLPGERQRIGGTVWNFAADVNKDKEWMKEENAMIDFEEVINKSLEVDELREELEKEKERADKADARAEQADARAEQADARAEQADARAEQADARAEQADARAEQADARVEILEKEIRELRLQLVAQS